MAEVIDVHNHFYPEQYIDAINKSDSDLTASEDEEGRRVLLSGGSRIVTLTPPMIDLETRIEHLEDSMVDRQVVSLSAPNVNFLSGEKSVELARICNDAYAEMNDDYDEIFPLASVPLRSPEDALQEAERAIEDLGLHGFIIGSNINGTPLNADRFERFYEVVAELDVPIFIHPMTPAGVEVMREYRLAPLVGFENEITMAITRLIFDGVLERYDLKIHLAHLGGTVPYLIERLNNGYRAYPECRQNIDQIPEHYLKEIYYDSVSFHPPALRCAIDSFGANQILVGSDYPHVIGDLERAVTDIEELRLTTTERNEIKSGNASRLYNI